MKKKYLVEEGMLLFALHADAYTTQPRQMVLMARTKSTSSWADLWLLRKESSQQGN